MAAKKKIIDDKPERSIDDDDITSTLVKEINKEFDTRVAYNLAEASAPTIVKRWISTGSTLLDYAIANKPGGGVPEGRIIELAGLPSTGKSHIAYETAKVVQRMGGIVVYVDTECATSVDKLHQMGLDVRKRFIYVDTHCTEEVFSVIESTITKAKTVLAKDLPILVVWDSIAATSPKAELEGDYEDNTMGLQARVLSKGFRKLTGVIGKNNITLLCLNQLREKLGGYGGDPYVSPGGKALPFHASVRIRLTGEGSQLKDKNGNVIGIRVPLNIIKNKVAPPFRKVSLEIRFGKGVFEDESLLDELIEWCVINKGVTAGDKVISIIGKGAAWKKLLVTSTDGEVLIEKAFTKNNFGELRADPAYNELLEVLVREALVTVYGDVPIDGGVSPKTDGDEEGDDT